MQILEAGDSKGDGEYWIDPEKNGSSLKVFCDMTTDGGKHCTDNSFVQYWPCIEEQRCREKPSGCLSLRKKNKTKHTRNNQIQKKHSKNATDKRGQTKTFALGEEFKVRPAFQVKVSKGWSQTLLE